MKRTKCYLLPFILVLTSLVSFAQNFTNYTEKDGLASDLVYRITQDHEGFIWFITDKGISKFDGTTFKNFTREDGLPVNTVIRFRITNDNRFWYFSRSYEMGYIENDSVYHFKSDNGVSMNPDKGINYSENDISILGDLQNYHFKDTTWISIDNKSNFKLLNRDIRYIRDSLGDYLAQSSGKKLYTFKDSSHIREAYQLNDSIFARLTNTGYTLVNLNSAKATIGEFTPAQDPFNVSMDFHWVNNRVQLVIGKYLYCFDENLEVELVQNSPEHLKPTFSFIDKDGFTWCATGGNGVYKFPTSFNSLDTFFDRKTISRISEVNNSIYVGVNGEGVYKFNNNQPELVVKERKPLYSIDKINETIFYGFGSHFIAQGKKQIKTAMDNDDYYAAGMVKYKERYYAEGCAMNYKINNDLAVVGNFKNYVRLQGLFEDRDSLFAFHFKDMLYYSDLKKRFLPYGEQQIGRTLLTHTTVNGTTYIGTEGDGLYSFYNGKLTKLVDKDLAVVKSIGIENERSIWVISEGVLLHYYQDTQGQYLIKKYEHLDGYPTNNLTQVYFHDSKLYLGATTGLVVLDKEQIKDRFNFDIYLKSIHLNGKIQSKDSLGYVYSSNLNLNVNFWSMNYYNSKNTTYQYRLDPIQNQWTNTKSGEVNLFDLQPNFYTLQLRANDNGISKQISVPIIVTPQWWQTALFRVVSFVLLGFLLVYIIWRWVKNKRIKREKKLLREKQLAQLQLKALRSQMNPHFVFNSLAAIQYYINENDFISSEKYLVKFSKLIRTFFELSKQTEITIENETALLTNYLDVERLRFRNKFDYTIDIDPNLDQWKNKIPTMLLQPIVENAINHGIFNKEEKGSIVIKFKKSAQDELNVSILDDGVGFKNTKKLESMTRTKSSNVLEDRLYYLNKSRFWRIEYNTEEAFPDRANTGNISTFILKAL